MFATGIENSCPVIEERDGRLARVDEMAKCGFYKYWKEDFRLVREVGLTYLRYGPQYFAVHTGPGKYDWSFSDETFAELQRLEITPIADLCHFGVPDWIGGVCRDWGARGNSTATRQTCGRRVRRGLRRREIPGA